MNDAPAHRDRILLVEDHRDLAASLLETLEENGFEPDYAGDGDHGLRLALSTRPPFDAVILDVGLPRLSGFEVCSALPREGFRAPILMLTAQGAADQIVQGLERGADDYIVKPFEARVLVARIRAAVRRHLRVPDGAGLVQAEGLALDTGRCQLLLPGGATCALTPLQGRLLHTLMRHAPRVVSRDELESALWGDEHRPSSDALRTHLYQLRRLIQQAGGPAVIRTCGKQGYCLAL
ncbi:response regulator transcription factor [Mitsuaria sp. GD03876]|uniref:response regulator transcription factor n=1 Tax=Mitsuaria sp. GD03876 TaxID=2975399 RepID=UPI002449E364|nr:response regulator transcription factor [Mitsuaria sp. GD03876]MDH0864323.1 response regulator transcription factor [Mitsuaria sp. GD03876]